MNTNISEMTKHEMEPHFVLIGQSSMSDQKTILTFIFHNLSNLRRCFLLLFLQCSCKGDKFRHMLYKTNSKTRIRGLFKLLGLS
jgi:hypothetical protein